MEILYSGAKNENDEQNHSEDSLGGFISSTNIPNDLVSNLFSVVSKSDISKKKRQFRIFFLRNNSENEIKNLKFLQKGESEYFQYSIAFLKPSKGNRVSMFSNKNELPPYEFTKIIKDEVINIVDSLQSNSSIAVVILRNFIQGFLPISCQKLHEDFITEHVSSEKYIASEIFEKSKDKLETVEFVFEYEEEE